MIVHDVAMDLILDPAKSNIKTPPFKSQKCDDRSRRTKTQTPSRRQTNYIQIGYIITHSPCTEFAFYQIL